MWCSERLQCSANIPECSKARQGGGRGGKGAEEAVGVFTITRKSRYVVVVWAAKTL